jgi:hemerythrin
MPCLADTMGMSLFDWKAEYAVGHPQIDSQHKRLYQLAADLHSAMVGGKAKDVLNVTLNNLIAYTKGHFANEERLMQMNHYPDYAKHKVLHDALTARVISFQKEFAAGRTSLSVDLLKFLSDWLRHHIGETDRKLARFVDGHAA